MSEKFAWKQYYLEKEKNELSLKRIQELESLVVSLKSGANTKTSKEDQDERANNNSDKIKIKRLEMALAALTTDEKGDTNMVKKLKNALNKMVGL